MLSHLPYISGTEPQLAIGFVMFLTSFVLLIQVQGSLRLIAESSGSPAAVQHCFRNRPLAGCNFSGAYSFSVPDPLRQILRYLSAIYGPVPSCLSVMNPSNMQHPKRRYVNNAA